MVWSGLILGETATPSPSSTLSTHNVTTSESSRQRRFRYFAKDDSSKCISKLVDRDGQLFFDRRIVMLPPSRWRRLLQTQDCVPSSGSSLMSQHIGAQTSPFLETKISLGKYSHSRCSRKGVANSHVKLAEVQRRVHVGGRKGKPTARDEREDKRNAATKKMAKHVSRIWHR